MNRSLIATVSALTAATLTGCFSHTVDVKPVEVKPVHITLDVNLKVDKELDTYFDSEKSSALDSEKTAPKQKQGEIDYSREAMIQRYKARKEVIADLKARGIVGEQRDETPTVGIALLAGHGIGLLERSDTDHAHAVDRKRFARRCGCLDIRTRKLLGTHSSNPFAICWNSARYLFTPLLSSA